MGCGSSKSAVAMINNDSGVTKSVQNEDIVKEVPVENKQGWGISVSSSTSNSPILDSKSNKKNSIIQVRNAFEEEVDVISDNMKTADDNVSNSDSIQNCTYGSKTKISSSIHSIKSLKSRGRSAGSMDSGVFDDGERKNSGRSGESLPGRVCSRGSEQRNSVLNNSETSLRAGSGKPPSGKKSSARKKLLRLNDDLNGDSEQNSNEPVPDSHENTTPDDHSQSMTLRPKSRFGNLAFDIVLDTPETGNAKKKPEKLAALTIKHKKKKKIKTKKDLDKKLEDAAARRQILEDEKLLKAKQFQHFAVSTPVEAFHPEQDDDDDDDENITSFQPIHTNVKVVNDSLSTNSNVALIDTSYDDDRKQDIVSQTIVEPFRLDSDDEDSFTESNFLDRAPPLSAVVAC